MKNLTLRQKIQQMFILGYDGPNPAEERNFDFINALKDGLGGVIFFTQNIINEKQFKNSIKYINENSLIKPFLSIDQEGGRVERTLNIHNGEKYLSARYAAQKDEDFLKKQTQIMAKELKDFGINLNFAPVLDVDTNPNNPIIAERSFSSNPEEVIKYGKIVIDTYKSHGIIPVGKHFPGHGDTAIDSHKSMPKVNLLFDELEEIHIKPFINLLKDLPAIMVAHVYYSAFDKEEKPASISQNVLNNYLRKKLGYNGLIISDDMVMGGIQGYSSIDACIQAINAGVNMFIFRNSDNATLSLFEQIENAVKSGLIAEEKINKSIEYIQKTKCF